MAPELCNKDKGYLDSSLSVQMYAHAHVWEGPYRCLAWGRDCVSLVFIRKRYLKQNCKLSSVHKHMACQSDVHLWLSDLQLDQ